MGEAGEEGTASPGPLADTHRAPLQPRVASVTSSEACRHV